MKFLHAVPFLVYFVAVFFGLDLEFLPRSHLVSGGVGIVLSICLMRVAYLVPYWKQKWKDAIDLAIRADSERMGAISDARALRQECAEIRSLNHKRNMELADLTAEINRLKYPPSKQEQTRQLNSARVAAVHNVPPPSSKHLRALAPTESGQYANHRDNDDGMLTTAAVLLAAHSFIEPSRSSESESCSRSSDTSSYDRGGDSGGSSDSGSSDSGGGGGCD